MPEYDRSAEDVGNVQMLEHVNVTVPDQGLAALFYVTGLGFTRDPYIDFGTYNMWVNLGEQQFHLPQSDAQILRGEIAVVVPNLEDLAKRLKFVSKALKDTRFSWEEADQRVVLSCPWGNRIVAYPAGSFPAMDLGMPYVDMSVPPGTAPGIARFYESVMGYDGHHIAIYVSDFSGPHRFLRERGLISQESDQHQYRFQKIVDPADDRGEAEPLFELEHEVRSLGHPMYRRPLVNRNPAVNFFTYRRGNEAFTPG